MKRKTLIIFWNNRSEEGLLRPIFARLEKTDIDWYSFRLPTEWDVGVIANAVDTAIKLHSPDYALCPFDRMPIAVAACVCHHKKVPFAQMHAGEISSGTFDDANRHVISLWADMLFCAHGRFSTRVSKLRSSAGLTTDRIYVVGITHLDDLLLDESLVPSCPYHLVLYNPPTKIPYVDMLDELEDVAFRAVLVDGIICWIAPNGDPGSDAIVNYVRELSSEVSYIKYYGSLPREQYLGLLKNASLAIGNSSSFIYEASALQTPVSMVGERNRIRERLRFTKGASDRIVHLIERRLLE